MADFKGELIAWIVKLVRDYLAAKGIEVAEAHVKKWLEEHPEEIKKIRSSAADVRSAAALLAERIGELIKDIVSAARGGSPDEQRWRGDTAPE